MRSVTATLLSVVLLGPVAVWGAAGDVDRTFGTEGGVITKIEDDEDSIIHQLVRQADGKLVAAGFAEPSGQGPVVALARYDDAGTLDPTFGVDGIVLTSFGSRPSTRALLLQPDGKLVVVLGINAETGIGLLRYDTNGLLDPSFGNGGFVATSLGGASEETVGGALQSDGKIVVVTDGATGADGPAPDDVRVLRYETDGSLDPTFGAGGVATVDFGGPDEAGAMLLEPDGRIVVAGYRRDEPEDLSQGSEVVIARLETDGSLDATFGTGGIFVHPRTRQDQPDAIARTPDGKLVVAISSRTWITPHNVVASEQFFLRVTDSGSRDSAFGVGGVVSASGMAVRTLTVTSAGDILVLGFSGGMGATRYHADGSLDTTFGNGGTITTQFTQTGSFAGAGLIDPDGRIVLGGYASEANATRNPPYFIDYYFALARLLGDGGTCTSDTDCAICQSCAPTGTCVVGPRTTCTGAAPGGASFALDSPGVDRDRIKASFARHRVTLRWRGVTPLGFDPGTDDVGLCVYLTNRRVMRNVTAVGTLCQGRPCWHGTAGTGYTYRNRDGIPNGIRKIGISPSEVRLDGSGLHLTETQHSVPIPEQLLQPERLVQVHLGSGACIQAVLTDVTPKYKSVGDGVRALVGVRGTGQ